MSLLSSVAERVKERRRIPKEGNSVDHNRVDFDAAVSQILNDKSIPMAMKTFMEIVVAKLGEIDDLIEENKKLRTEVEVLRKENSELKKLKLSDKSVSSSPMIDFSTQHDTAPIHDASCCEAKEMARSLVIVGIPELSNALPSAQVSHDVDCVCRLFNFLGIPCHPVTVYRMGRIGRRSPRLLKVVLPSSYFRNEALRRAPYLRGSPFGSTFIRPSLPKAERDRLRAQRSEKREKRSSLFSRAHVMHDIDSTVLSSESAITSQSPNLNV